MRSDPAVLFFILVLSACAQNQSKEIGQSKDELVISRASYKDQVYGFWLGQYVANWSAFHREGSAGAIGRYRRQITRQLGNS